MASFPFPYYLDFKLNPDALITRFTIVTLATASIEQIALNVQTFMFIVFVLN